VEVNQISSRSLSLTLLEGAISADITMANADDTFEINAGNVVMGIRGTSFIVEYRSAIPVFIMLTGSGDVDGTLLTAGNVAKIEAGRVVVAQLVIDDSLSQFALHEIIERKDAVIQHTHLAADDIAAAEAILSGEAPASEPEPEPEPEQQLPEAPVTTTYILAIEGYGGTSEPMISITNVTNVVEDTIDEGYGPTRILLIYANAPARATLLRGTHPNFFGEISRVILPDNMEPRNLINYEYAMTGNIPFAPVEDWIWPSTDGEEDFDAPPEVPGGSTVTLSAGSYKTGAIEYFFIIVSD